MRTPTAALFLLTFVTTPIFGYGIGKRDSINPILRRSAHHGRDVIPVMPAEPDTTTTDPATTSTTDSASQPTSTTTTTPDDTIPFTFVDQIAYLTAHNDVRSRHGADPLVWSEDLESYAQEWASKCSLQTSGGAFGQFGENVVAGSGTFSATAAVNTWADTQAEYNPASPAPNNWSQIVWKGTTRIGCAASICPNLLPGSGAAVLHSCFYNPPGNVKGYYSDNVQV